MGSSGSPGLVDETAFNEAVARVRPTLHDNWRALHAIPELAFDESKTAEYLVDRLSSLDRCHVDSRFAGTGVRASIRGREKGRTVLLRADMDALPSGSDGIEAAHTCGHDGHMATLLSVAELLSSTWQEWSGTVVLVFQPAEETLEGCRAMLDDGLLDDVEVDAGFAYHLWNFEPVGTVGVRAGPSHAGLDYVSLTVEGRGGHGGMPHLGVDTVAVGMQILGALQGVVANSSSPFDPAVLTFGEVRAGTAPNVLATRFEAHGTLRAMADEVRSGILRAASDVAARVAEGLQASARVSTNGEGCPSLVSEPRLAELVREAAEEMTDAVNVVEHAPVMGSEDAAFLFQRVPGCYFVVGSQNPHSPHPLHHEPGFEFEIGALEIAVEVMTRATYKALDERVDLARLKKEVEK